MNEYKIGFVILHYKALKATIDCIQSIKKNIDSENYEIVIVDNFSNDGTGEVLLQKYCSDSMVHIIINEGNLGFARGNNIGFEYAKTKLDVDFICMMNNDTLVIQNDFTEVIYESYKKHNYAVLGPSIYMKDGQIYDKFTFELKTKQYYTQELKNQKQLLFLSHFNLDNKNLRNPFRKIEEYERDVESKYSPFCEYEDVVLHGCCLVFSPKYLELFDGIDDRTFLFREEELLYLRVMNNNMHTLYSPKLKIKHLEDVSTDMVVKSEKQKRVFLYKNQIQSLKVLLEEMGE